MNALPQTESDVQAVFDPVAAGRKIDAVADDIKQAEQRKANAEQALEANREVINEGNAKLVKLLAEAKAAVADFKAFVETHTHIAYSTAKRLLDIQDPERAEEVRATERARQQRHRTAKAVTSNVTASNVVPIRPTVVEPQPEPEPAAAAPATPLERFKQACDALDNEDDLAEAVAYLDKHARKVITPEMRLADAKAKEKAEKGEDEEAEEAPAPAPKPKAKRKGAKK